MAHILRRLVKCPNGTAAVEAAIFAPIFLTLTLGITDLGISMFMRMTVNAAVQAGASFAVANSGPHGVCAALTTTCLNDIYGVMNDATGMNGSNGQPPFCTGSVCTASFTSCPEENGGTCFTVSANYSFLPLLPNAIYSWAKVTSVSYTTTVRVT